MPTYARELNNLRLAVLIDAENVPRNSIKSVMEEIAIYGTPTIKRIYGDWTNPVTSRWKASLLENAITPIQQYSYTIGKNSSDSAMIIDAMDILYTERTDGFVIVSSDSDFTRLAIRLREAGQRVIGIGERKTPSAFIAACDKFTYIEVIRARAVEHRGDGEETGHESEDSSRDIEDSEDGNRVSEDTGRKSEDAGRDGKSRGLSMKTGVKETAENSRSIAESNQSGTESNQSGAESNQSGTESSQSGTESNQGSAESGQKSQSQHREKQNAPQRPKNVKIPKKIIQLIADSVADLADESGVVFMGELGNLIMKKQPDFDNRNYGYKSLSAMIKSIDRFDIDFRQTTDPNIKHVFVRDKEAT